MADREPNRDPLRDHAERIATVVVDRAWDASKSERWGDSGRKRCIEDTRSHLAYLREAVRSDSYRLFREYVQWARSLLSGYDVPWQDLEQNLRSLAEALGELPPEAATDTAIRYLERSAAELPHMADQIASYITRENPHRDLAKDYLDDLLSGNRQDASARILDAVSHGTSVRDIYSWVFQPVQHEIGRRWQLNQISIAEEHFCTAATQMIMCQLYPYIFSGTRNGRTFVGACVTAELHEIGIRMVTDFFEMAGWDTYFVGANTPTRSVLDHIEARGADVVGVSATVTPHVSHVRDFIQELRARAKLAGTRVIVGGYPFNREPELWKNVGADGYASDADGAIELAASLVGER